MEYQVVNANEWLYPDKRVKLGGEKKLNLFCARGSYATAQILLGRLPSGEKIACRLRGDAADLWPYSVTMEVYRQVDVRVNANTGPKDCIARSGDDPTPYVTRLAPFRVYDCLRPLTSACATNRGTNALYIAIRVPAETPAGLYKGSVKLRVGEKEAKIPLKLRVYAACVPEKGNLIVTNWFNYDNIASRHGLEKWSDAHFEMIRRYALSMRRARQNMFCLPSPTACKNEDGSYSFDFSIVERVIRMFLDLGFEWIEGAHVARHAKEDKTRFALAGFPDETREVFATDAEGYAFLAQKLAAQYAFIEKNGWKSRWLQHVADEPWAEDAADYRVLAGIVRQYMPDIRLLDAITYTGVPGSVDIYIPTNNYYQQHADLFEDLRTRGTELWYYTCCNPGGAFINRTIDIPLIKSRYLHWGNYKYNFRGFLHWGYNKYRENQDPFEQTAINPAEMKTDFVNGLQAGDTHLVYPGSGMPWLSRRLEAMRAGAEDYELLCLLARKNKEKADALCNRLMRAFDDVELDTDVFEHARRELLTALSEENIKETDE